MCIPDHGLRGGLPRERFSPYAVSGLSRRRRLIGQRYKPEVLISGRSCRPAIHPLRRSNLIGLQLRKIWRYMTTVPACLGRPCRQSQVMLLVLFGISPAVACSWMELTKLQGLDCQVRRRIAAFLARCISPLSARCIIQYDRSSRRSVELHVQCRAARHGAATGRHRIRHGVAASHGAAFVPFCNDLIVGVLTCKALAVEHDVEHAAPVQYRPIIPH